MDASGNFLGFDGLPVTLPTRGRAIALNDCTGTGTNGGCAFADQAYPGQTFEPMRQFYDPGARLTTNLAISGKQLRPLSISSRALTPARKVRSPSWTR